MSAETAMGAALERVLGAAAHDVDVELVPGPVDTFEVAARNGRLHVTATTPATALHGLRTASQADGVAWDEIGDLLPARAPAVPVIPVTATARFPHRFYGNDTEDAYVGAYRDFSEWEKQIDGLAAKGINEVFVPVGTDAVYVDLLIALGYSEEEALAWVPLPTHQPWWLLQNMSGYPAGMTRDLVRRRAELGARIIRRLHDLGMRAVVPGYSGMVPRDFASRHDARVHVPENDWQGFDRPGWLDPSDPIFADVAARFYDASARILGETSMVKMDVLHEGGTPGFVDVTAAAGAIQDALELARPGSTWVMLGWQHNPPIDLLRGLDVSRTLVVDGLSDRHPDLDRERDLLGAPYAFGAIWNFGGDTAMGAQAATWTERLDAWADADGSTMAGVAAMPEGGYNNPFALDYLEHLAWNRASVPLQDWAHRWVADRYGADQADAVAAWRRIVETAYTLPDDNGFSEPHDALFAAWPHFEAATASSFSPTEVTYDLEAFGEALGRLLLAAPELGDVPAYRFDLADVARQTVSNTSRQLLPAIRAANVSGDAEAYDRLTGLWRRSLLLLDDIAGTQRLWLVGRLLDEARAAATTDADADVFERSQRIILTTWGTERASTEGRLADYAGREYQGLLRSVYLPRWETFFAEHHPVTGERVETPMTGWWRHDQDWIQSLSREGIRTEPSGDPIALAAAAEAHVTEVRAALTS